MLGYNKYLLPTGDTNYRTPKDAYYTEKVLIRENPNLIDELPGEGYVYPETFTESKFFGSKHEPDSDKDACRLKPQASNPQAFSRLMSVGSDILGSKAMQFSPMRLHRVIGRTPNIPVINLTGIHQSHIVYAASNVVVILDYYKNRQYMLQGHKNKISCLVKEPDSRYIASAATGKGSVVVIWECETGLPYRVIHPSALDYGITAVGFAKGIEIIGSLVMETKITEPPVENSNGQTEVKPNTITEHVLKIWFYGKPKKGDAKLNIVKHLVSLTLPQSIGTQKHLHFCHDRPDFIMTSGERTVAFYTWLKDEKEIIYHIPKITKGLIRRVKSFTKSLWIDHESCLTATSGGYIILWSVQAPLGLEEPANPNHNVKEYKRCYKIGDVGLTSLCRHKEFYIVGDKKGNIKFFDEKFRIVRWTKTLNVQPIDSISPNITDEIPTWKFELQSMYKSETGMQPNQGDGISAVKDYTLGGRMMKTLSQTTVERQPFVAPDLVVSFAAGDGYYYHMNERKYDQIVQPSLSMGQIAALDTCPNSTHIALISPDGYVQLYDYIMHTLIFSGRILTKKTKVTYFKFHPSGSFGFLAAADGNLYFRRSYTFSSLGAPLDNCKDPVRRIEFSCDGLHMAHSDDSHCITLYYYHSRRSAWGLKGRLRSHFKTIVDLAFQLDARSNRQRLFSLGADRRLIEYDVANSNEGRGLVVLSITYVTQLCSPTAMTFDSPFPNHGPIILFANSENKIKLFDQDCHKIRRTCQGPSYGSLITRMKEIAPEVTTGRSTKFILMVLGNKVGVIKTPVDGNPFKYMAVLGHPFNIIEVVIGHGGSEIFTFAENDNCCMMWEPNIQALETSSLAGGSGIKPFQLLLDANLPPGSGSIAEDVENIFFHLMTKKSKSQEELLKMAISIRIDEIPIVMRACGYFPTEYQIDEIIEEAKFITQLKTGKEEAEIAYDEFLILFANHKQFVITPTDVRNAFEVLGEYNENDELCIPRKQFVQYLTTRGEPINELDLPLFIPTMYRSVQFDVMDTDSEPAFKFFMPGDDLSNYASKLPSQESMSQLKKPDPTKRISKKSFMKFQKPESLIHLVNIDSKPSNMISFGEDGEDEECAEEAESFCERDLPEDITADYFIENILTEESYKTMDWTTAVGTESDLAELRELYSKFPDRESWDGSKLRKKRREEWKILTEIFNNLKDRDFSIAEKMKLTRKLLRYFRYGDWNEKTKSEPPPSVPTEYLGEFAEEGEDSELSYFDDLADRLSLEKMRISIKGSVVAPDGRKISGGSDEFEGESQYEVIPDGSWEGEHHRKSGSGHSSTKEISDTEMEILLKAEDDFEEEESEKEEAEEEEVDEDETIVTHEEEHEEEDEAIDTEEETEVK